MAGFRGSERPPVLLVLSGVFSLDREGRETHNHCRGVGASQVKMQDLFLIVPLFCVSSWSVTMLQIRQKTILSKLEKVLISQNSEFGKQPLNWKL